MQAARLQAATGAGRCTVLLTAYQGKGSVASSFSHISGTTPLPKALWPAGSTAAVQVAASSCGSIKG